MDDLVSGDSSCYLCSRRILWPVIGRGREREGEACKRQREEGKGGGGVGGGGGREKVWIHTFSILDAV